MIQHLRAICRFAPLLVAALAPCAHALETHEPASEQEYWALIERKDWDQAVLTAEKLVEAARLRANEAPTELAQALTLLGTAQFAKSNWISAQAAYSEAIQILEPRLVGSQDKLLEPLRGMGYSLAFAGKHQEAIPYMERALLVSRRTHGVFNLDQQGLLRQLANSLAHVGRYVEAEQQMHYLVRVGEHAYGKKNPRMADFYDALGDFYMQLRLPGAARESYRKALKIVENKLGRNDPATVPPLRALANTYRNELLLSRRMPPERRADPDVQTIGRSANPRLLSVEGERALRRALKTLEAHPANSTSLLFDTLLDLGDWHMIKSETKQSLGYYRRAAALLNEFDAAAAVAARAKLGFPVQLYYAIPASALRNLQRAPEEIEERFVHVAFTVTSDGSVKDVRLVEANAPQRYIDDTIDAVRSARYRPKFVDAEPVTTHDVGLRQIFKIRKEQNTE
jgi:tetratricopeptide (TPR) repeat protein